MPVHPPARTLNLPALSSVWQVASVLLALCGMSPLTDVCLYTNVLVSAEIRMPIIRAYTTFMLFRKLGHMLVWSYRKTSMKIDVKKYYHCSCGVRCTQVSIQELLGGATGKELTKTTHSMSIMCFLCTRNIAMLFLHAVVVVSISNQFAYMSSRLPHWRNSRGTLV